MENSFTNYINNNWKGQGYETKRKLTIAHSTKTPSIFTVPPETGFCKSYSNAAVNQCLTIYIFMGENIGTTERFNTKSALECLLC